MSLSSREISGVIGHPFPMGSAIALPRKVLELRRIVREINPDLVHAHQAVGYGLWGALSGRHPYVVSAWGSDVLIRPRESWVQGQVVRYVVRRADFCIPVARHLQERMVPFGLRPERCEAIPMGVELDRHPPRPYRAGTRPASFISTRALAPLYDLETLVRASKAIFAADPDVQGTILGDGPQRAALEGLSKELGVTSRLAFGGLVPEDRVVEALGSTPVYVSTSRSDGASVSLLEAMSQGCFPVATDIPANREWIVPGENGLLFPVGDAGALAAAVQSVLHDEEWLERASRHNIELVAQRGDLNRNLERVAAVYERLRAPWRGGSAASKG